jgi:hypothetical protein
MNFLVLAVLIDSIVVITVGTRLQRTAKREAKMATESFKTALQDVGPEVVAQAIAMVMAGKVETKKDA